MLTRVQTTKPARRTCARIVVTISYFLEIMNNNHSTEKGYAYLSPNISVRNSRELPTFQKLKTIANGAGQSLGGTTPSKRALLNPRLTDPLNYT
jgi:hypothetical protein